MRDVVALLKAHNPEPDGSSAPPFERVLERFDAEPAPTSWRPRTWWPVRSRRPLVAALAIGATATALLALTFGIGGERTGVVEAAGAAISGEGVIVHTVSRTTLYNADGTSFSAYMRSARRRFVTMGPVERWSASSPSRWRSVTHLLPGPGMPGDTVTTAYADGVVRSRKSWEAGTSVSRHVRSGTGSASLRLLEGTADPLGAVRAMLASGEVREDGETMRDGRHVLRLVGERPTRVTVRNGFEYLMRVVYLVDAETHAPVEVERRIFLSAPNGEQTPGQIWRTRYDRYERLPMTPRNEQLLRLGRG